MFHYKRFASLKAILSAIFTALILTFSVPNALAAVVPGADLSDDATRTLSASLKALTGKNELILDHTTGKAEFTFDIPAGDYASDLRLKIRAIPQGNVDNNARIMVKFNAAKAVPIESRGNGFSAEIKLSGARVRSQNNTVTLTYTGAAPGICTPGDHGKWIVDLQASRLSADVRSKRAGYNISHIERRLAHPMTTPKTVAIIAKGSNKSALEALTAQAIGLRVTDIPNFKLRDTKADLKIYVGTRAELGRAIRDAGIAGDDRPVIGVQFVNRSPQLVITADTQQDVKALVQSFAYAHLPRSRRSRISLSDMSVQMPFSYETPAPVSGRTSWGELGGYNFDLGLSPAPTEARFKVNNAQMSTGELRLGLSKSDDITNTSRIAVALNGAPLGYTKLNKQSKTVAFPFPAGSLLSGDNTITVTPALMSNNACAVQAGISSGVLLTGSSALIIDTPKGGHLDLGSIAGGGAPFSNASGALTDVYFTGNANDRAAALKILAKAAQTSGEGWTAANFISRAPYNLDSERNALVLGPLPAEKLTMLSSAPRAFQNAMRGRLPIEATKVASNTASQAFAMAARQSTSNTARSASGVAAVYANGDGGNAIGVISSPRPHDFSKLANALVKDPNWSNLSGGVAKWDRNQVTLLQTADTRLVAKPSQSRGTGAQFSDAIADLNMAVSSRFNSGLTALAALKQNPMQKSAQVVPSREQLKSAPALSMPPATTPKLAPVIQTVSYSPAALRGRSAPAVMPINNTATAKPIRMGHFLDWSDFDAGYLKAKVSSKVSRPLGRTGTFKLPSLSSASSKIKRDVKSVSTPRGTSKWLLILLVGVMALMLFGLAAPASSNKNIR